MIYLCLTIRYNDPYKASLCVVLMPRTYGAHAPHQWC